MYEKLARRLEALGFRCAVETRWTGPEPDEVFAFQTWLRGDEEQTQMLVLHQAGAKIWLLTCPYRDSQNATPPFSPEMVDALGTPGWSLYNYHDDPRAPTRDRVEPLVPGGETPPHQPI